MNVIALLHYFLSHEQGDVNFMDSCSYSIDLDYLAMKKYLCSTEAKWMSKCRELEQGAQDWLVRFAFSFHCWGFLTYLSLHDFPISRERFTCEVI
jgi:hypothetical protein